MLPLPLTFGLVPILIDLCKCRSSWIYIFVSRPYVFVGTLLCQFDSLIDLPCFALYVSHVSKLTIIVIGKCIEFALLTFDLVGFERILLIAICFCIFWYFRICFLPCCHSLIRLNLEFFPDWSVIECFLGNTISLGCWIVIRTYLIPLTLRSISLELITGIDS